MKINEVLAKPTLHMAIAPSGAGKSTLFRKLKANNPQLQLFSLDALRHEWYDAQDYKKAWEAAAADPEFKNKANQRFMDMIKERKELFIDNTNLTPKRRRFYLDTARRAGYQTIGYTFNVDLPTLIARQATRGDKNVPEEAVRSQYQSLVPPRTGEFDKVISAEHVR